MQVQRIPLTKPNVMYTCVHKDDNDRLVVELIDHYNDNYSLTYHYANQHNTARATYTVQLTSINETTSKYILVDNPSFRLSDSLQLKLWHMTMAVFTRCLDVHSVPLTQLVE